jgi:hypothetical protein
VLLTFIECYRKFKDMESEMAEVNMNKENVRLIWTKDVNIKESVCQNGTIKSQWQ